MLAGGRACNKISATCRGLPIAGFLRKFQGKTRILGALINKRMYVFLLVTTSGDAADV